MKNDYKEYRIVNIFLLVIFVVLLFSCKKNNKNKLLPYENKLRPYEEGYWSMRDGFLDDKDVLKKEDYDRAIDCCFMQFLRYTKPDKGIIVW